MNKLKLNLLDLMIIAAVVMVLVLGIFILKGNPGSAPSAEAPQNTTAVFCLQIKDAEKSLGEKFLQGKEENDPVWIGIKERFEGRIVDVEVIPAERNAKDIYNGKAVISPSQILYDINVTVEAAAVETDSAITASGTAIRVGEQTAIRSKEFAGFGYIIDLKTKSNGN